MAHFAKIDANNIVTQVIVVNNDDIKDNSGTETEAIGVAFCQKLMGADTNWKQTSYKASFRGNFAGIGMTYMTNVETMGVASTDIFINQQPFASWGIAKTDASWVSGLGTAPSLSDSDRAAGKYYYWDEAGHQADSSTPKTVGWAITTGNGPGS